MNSKKTIILDTLMLVPNNNPQGFKEHVPSFIAFEFVEGVTIIDWLSNMKLYMYDSEESYKDTIIGHLGNSGTSDLLLHILQCWHKCANDEENWALIMVLQCLHKMYRYYSRLWFFSIKQNKKRKDTHN